MVPINRQKAEAVVVVDRKWDSKTDNLISALYSFFLISFMRFLRSFLSEVGETWKTVNPDSEMSFKWAVKTEQDEGNSGIYEKPDQPWVKDFWKEPFKWEGLKLLDRAGSYIKNFAQCGSELRVKIRWNCMSNKNKTVGSDRAL